VKYELRFYIPEDDILHSYRRENLKYDKRLRELTLFDIKRPTSVRDVTAGAPLHAASVLARQRGC
jgi:hypothetical protein